MESSVDRWAVFRDTAVLGGFSEEAQVVRLAWVRLAPVAFWLLSPADGLLAQMSIRLAPIWRVVSVRGLVSRSFTQAVSILQLPARTVLHLPR